MDKISRDVEFLEEALAGYRAVSVRSLENLLCALTVAPSHRRCVQVDDFTAKLFGILKHVHEEGRTQVRGKSLNQTVPLLFWLLPNVSLLQSIAVSLNRSDYMLDQSEDGSTSLKQIEFNTFSVAGFGVTDSLPEVHRYDEAEIGILKC